MATEGDSNSIGEVQVLASFVPCCVRQHFVTRNPDGKYRTSKPFMEDIGSACVAFIDLSGFTAYSSKCAAEEGGIEKLTIALNSAMDRMLRYIEPYGGDILKVSDMCIIS